MLPPALLARYQGARRVAEIAAGARFGTALGVARALPGTRLVVTDVDPRVREAPAPLQGEVDDLRAPAWGLYEGAALVYAERLPEELHGLAARLAARVGADLALRLLGDEAPALPEPAERFPGPDGVWLWWPPHQLPSA